MAPFRRTGWYGLIALFLTALLYYAWTKVSSPWGNQTVAFRASERQCGTVGALRYCVYRDAGGTNGDIVYHLHGRNLDEKVWNDDTYFTAMLQQQWQRLGTKPPTVVAISYGPVWLLTPKGQKSDSGLLDDFLARLPEIEAKLGPPRRRILLGESMGGLNVLIAGFSAPSQFAKVAALSPGVYVSSPFAPLSTTRAAIARTGASPKIVLGILLLARTYVADEEEWRRISPLKLAEQAGPDHPALYLTCGLYDNYGNYEGTQRLADLATQRGVHTEWHPLYGGHGAVDVPSLANFLVK